MSVPYVDTTGPDRSPDGPADWSYLLVWLAFFYLPVWWVHPSQVDNVIFRIWCFSGSSQLQHGRDSFRFVFSRWFFRVARLVALGFLAVGAWLVQRSSNYAFGHVTTSVHHGYWYSIFFIVLTAVAQKIGYYIYFSYLWFEAAIAMTLVTGVMAVMSLIYITEIKTGDNDKYWLFGALIAYLVWLIVLLIGQAYKYATVTAKKDVRHTADLPAEQDWFVYDYNGVSVFKSATGTRAATKQQAKKRNLFE